MFSASSGLSSRATLHEIRFTHIPRLAGDMGSKPAMTNRGVLQSSQNIVVVTQRFKVESKGTSLINKIKGQ
jgi:hypothetical protein